MAKGQAEGEGLTDTGGLVHRSRGLEASLVPGTAQGDAVGPTRGLGTSSLFRTQSPTFIIKGGK